jgi:alcohol dehydrogenase
MKAAIFEQFAGPVTIRQVPDPTPERDGVVIRVRATGLCRSDWHGWMGHDADVKVPHVPGHELAGDIVAVGAHVQKWQVGDRVTVPFAGGCGYCRECVSGNQHICDNYFQPGFTAWGSFAEYVAIRYADVNLVQLPQEIDYVTAATLGCRFITSFRAVVDQGRVQGGQWVVVHGCGGVGLSAVMIAAALGAQVIGVDVSPQALALARQVGAVQTLDGSDDQQLLEAIQRLTGGGAHLSLDALGSHQTARNSILSLRKRGRHVQVGLMAGEDGEPPLPMSQVIAKELEIVGSHGMQAHRYPLMLEMIRTGQLQPQQLVQRTITLQEAPQALEAMGRFATPGVTVIVFE